MFRGKTSKHGFGLFCSTLNKQVVIIKKIKIKQWKKIKKLF
jgi:hypothetical protein